MHNTHNIHIIMHTTLAVLNKHTLVHDVNRLSTLTHAKGSIIRV